VRLLLIPVLLAFATACPLPQPGCTEEAVKSMVNDCRVQFEGAPPRCLVNVPPAPGTDLSRWDVRACNLRPGNGALAQCLQGKAAECRAAGSRTDAVVTSCLPAETQAPEKSCDDACGAAYGTCDDRCTGGLPCNMCRRTGGSCTDVCPTTGYAACADCSLDCAAQLFACRDRCPRR
jgi:hypothetical protein